MARIEQKTKRYPSDLTDEEWGADSPFPARRVEEGGLTFAKF
jgi:hypothetical protein